MIEQEKALVVDVDGTLCPIKQPNENYADLHPEPRVLARLIALHSEGWRIILYTARGMRSSEGNIGEINKNVIPSLIGWLQTYQVPFDELHVGKPWPGRQGIYVDDRAVRPREFVELDLESLNTLMEEDRLARPCSLCGEEE